MQLAPCTSTVHLISSINQIVEYVTWEEKVSSDSIEIDVDFDFDRGLNQKLDKGITDLTWFTDNIFCLITNAVKYSIQPEGIKIAIKTVLNGADNYAVFSVQDSGISLSVTQLELLFDPPVQVRLTYIYHSIRDCLFDVFSYSILYSYYERRSLNCSGVIKTFILFCSVLFYFIFSFYLLDFLFLFYLHILFFIH